ncbi:DNA polymerase III subunit alpha [Pseudomonas aeruginosa]|nr:DNA polymerase III subunit alpha [Pseudomonas aeruginosa]
MVDDFINRKHGRAELSYPHPDYQYAGLEPVLKPTYGIILYQEQVMQIAQVMAGYTLGGADMLRRAMGKKKPEEMAKQRGGFIEGCKNNGIDADLAGNIFDLVEKFAGYGFNKSHSAAYGLVSYQTAWLKTHFPAPFMAAVLTADMQNTDKVVTLIEECRHMKLRIVAPDVNNSEFRFTVDDDGRIVYGLGAIKGVGEGPVEAITECRAEGGPFNTLFDFCDRVDLKRINKRTLEALIRAGALDRLGPHYPRRAKGLPGYCRPQPRRAAGGDGGSDPGRRADRAQPRQRAHGPVRRSLRRAGGGCLRQPPQGQGADPQGTPEGREGHPRPVPDRPSDRRVRRRGAALSPASASSS